MAIGNVFCDGCSVQKIGMIGLMFVGGWGDGRPVLDGAWDFDVRLTYSWVLVRLTRDSFQESCRPRPNDDDDKTTTPEALSPQFFSIVYDKRG
jgi:hypothetical protein